MDVSLPSCPSTQLSWTRPCPCPVVGHVGVSSTRHEKDPRHASVFLPDCLFEPRSPVSCNPVHPVNQTPRRETQASAHKPVAMASSSIAPILHSQTMAEDCDGFPPILSSMLTQALGCNTTPLYLVFQSEPVPHLCRFFARTHVNPGPAPDGRPMIFLGKPMPTPALAVQMAAAEAIALLRFKCPQVAEMREFRFFPAATSSSCEFSSPVEDADPTIACLVQFIAAQGLLLTGIREEFESVDRDTLRVVTEAHREARQTAPQTTRSLLPNPVPPSHLVPCSYSANLFRPGNIHPNSILGAIRRLHRRDVFGRAPAVAPVVEPQPIVVPEDEGRGWLSLRLSGEPQWE
jgi:hypothetical protein